MTSDSWSKWYLRLTVSELIYMRSSWRKPREYSISVKCCSESDRLFDLICVGNSCKTQTEIFRTSEQYLRVWGFSFEAGFFCATASQHIKMQTETTFMQIQYTAGEWMIKPDAKQSQRMWSSLYDMSGVTCQVTHCNLHAAIAVL